MTTATPPTPLSDALGLGLQTISIDQSITFKQYERVVLTQDGSVFWVYNGISQPFTGSLHIITERQQNEDETLGANSLIFSAKTEVTELNSIASDTLWIGEWDTDNTSLKVAFSGSGSNYQQAGLFHYRGFAVYPALQSQLIESEYDIPNGLIVSNSLPVWLSLSTPELPIYPSFLMPDNIAPPYIAAHIEPSQTEAMQFPMPTGTESVMAIDQLAVDNVRLTLYGVDNQKSMQFLQSLVDYSLDTDNFGFMDIPVVRDEKRTQVEIATVAMKKTIAFRASYYQSAADVVARKLILAAGIQSLTIN